MNDPEPCKCSSKKESFIYIYIYIYVYIYVILVVCSFLLPLSPPQTNPAPNKTFTSQTEQLSKLPPLDSRTYQQQSECAYFPQF